MSLRSGGNFAHDGIGAMSEFDKSLTQQSQKDEADINTIVRRFGVTGMLPQINAEALNIEFVDCITYHDAMNALRAADEEFMKLDANVRLRFNNDPGEFLTFVENPDNLDALREMGLAVPKIVEDLTNGEAGESGNSPGRGGEAGGE